MFNAKYQKLYQQVKNSESNKYQSIAYILEVTNQYDPFKIFKAMLHENNWTDTHLLEVSASHSPYIESLIKEEELIPDDFNDLEFMIVSNNMGTKLEESHTHQYQGGKAIFTLIGYILNKEKDPKEPKLLVAVVKYKDKFMVCDNQMIKPRNTVNISPRRLLLLYKIKNVKDKSIKILIQYNFSHFT